MTTWKMSVGRSGGWVTLSRGKVTTTGETALESKARASVVNSKESRKAGSKR